jgi:hypothetical protein
MTAIQTSTTGNTASTVIEAKSICVQLCPSTVQVSLSCSASCPFAVALKSASIRVHLRFVFGFLDFIRVNSCPFAVALYSLASAVEKGPRFLDS